MRKVSFKKETALEVCNQFYLMVAKLKKHGGAKSARTWIFYAVLAANIHFVSQNKLSTGSKKINMPIC